MNSSTGRFFRAGVGALLRTRIWPKLCDALGEPDCAAFESIWAPCPSCPPEPKRMDHAPRSAEYSCTPFASFLHSSQPPAVPEDAEDPPHAHFRCNMGVRAGLSVGCAGGGVSTFA